MWSLYRFVESDAFVCYTGVMIFAEKKGVFLWMQVEKYGGIPVVF